jgi:starch synthase
MINKQSLQQTLGLPIDNRIPLLAMVGRIDRQKGLDIIFDALRMLAEEVWQFVLLGTGDPVLETAAGELQQKFPDRARVNLLFDSQLSRQIYAGADCLVMPSRYEPCGLAQMIAMRYGCLPLVHATGGLKDTVSEGRTGFLFESPDAAGLTAKLKLVLDLYGSDRWKDMQSNAMKVDFSWGRSAREYAALYAGLIHSNPDQVR